MKSVLTIAVPALLLMSASAFAADPGMQPSGGKADASMSAGTGGLQGSTTGQAYMNGPAGNGSSGNGTRMSGSVVNSSSSGSSTTTDTSSMSASAQTSSAMAMDSSPTYKAGRKSYRGKSEASLNKKESQETAQLNQQYGVTTH